MPRRKSKNVPAAHSREWLKRELSHGRIDFDGLNFSYQDFSNMMLNDCSFRRCNMKGTQLYSCSLVRCDFTRANLSSANLSCTNVTSATFHGANLKFAHLPAPSVMLTARWAVWEWVSLTGDLMLWDEANHSNPALFPLWAKGGDCPYHLELADRASTFTQSQAVYKLRATEVPDPYTLMMRAFKASKIQR